MSKDTKFKIWFKEHSDRIEAVNTIKEWKALRKEFVEEQAKIEIQCKQADEVEEYKTMQHQRREIFRGEVKAGAFAINNFTTEYPHHYVPEIQQLAKLYAEEKVPTVNSEQRDFIRNRYASTLSDKLKRKWNQGVKVYREKHKVQELNDKIHKYEENNIVPLIQMARSLPRKNESLQRNSWFLSDLAKQLVLKRDFFTTSAITDESLQQILNRTVVDAEKKVSEIVEKKSDLNE